MNVIDKTKKQSADDFYNFVKPALEKNCGAQVVSLEKMQGKLPLMLDREFSTDALFIKNGKMFGLSSRIQHGKNWQTFSIRAKRDSGTKSEFEKHSDAIKKQTYLPELTSQAYFTGAAFTVALVRTKDILDYIKRHNPTPIHTGKDEIGQAAFYPVSWQDFQAKGYHLKLIHENKKSVLHDGVDL